MYFDIFGKSMFQIEDTIFRRKSRSGEEGFKRHFTVSYKFTSVPSCSNTNRNEFRSGNGALGRSRAHRQQPTSFLNPGASSPFIDTPPVAETPRTRRPRPFHETIHVSKTLLPRESPGIARQKKKKKEEPPRATALSYNSLPTRTCIIYTKKEARFHSMWWKDSWAKRWHEWRLVRRSRGQDTMQGAASPLTRRGLDLFPCTTGQGVALCEGRGGGELSLSLSQCGTTAHVQRQHATRTSEVSLLWNFTAPGIRRRPGKSLSCHEVGAHSLCRVLCVTGFDETEESGIAEERPTFYGCKRWSCLARDERRGLDTVDSGEKGGFGFLTCPLIYVSYLSSSFANDDDYFVAAFRFFFFFLFHFYDVTV